MAHPFYWSDIPDPSVCRETHQEGDQAAIVQESAESVGDVGPHLWRWGFDALAALGLDILFGLTCSARLTHVP